MRLIEQLVIETVVEDVGVLWCVIWIAGDMNPFEIAVR